MTWTDLEPYATAGGPSRLGAVMLSASIDNGRYRAMTIITIRPRAWETGDVPAFLALGKLVNVQTGSGDYRGHIRIVPGSLFRIGAVPKGNGTMRIGLPTLPGQKAGKQRPIVCDYDFNDMWLDITLPAWAKAAAAVPQPALSPEAAKRFGREAA